MYSNKSLDPANSKSSRYTRESTTTSMCSRKRGLIREDDNDAGKETAAVAGGGRLLVKSVDAYGNDDEMKLFAVAVVMVASSTFSA